MPSGRVIVHAGRLWDGTGPTVQSDVDIVIEGNRIQNIRPPGDGRRSPATGPPGSSTPPA